MALLVAQFAGIMERHRNAFSLYFQRTAFLCLPLLKPIFFTLFQHFDHQCNAIFSRTFWLMEQ